MRSCGAFVDGAVDVDMSTRRGMRVAAAPIDDLIAGVDLVKLDIDGLKLEVLGSSRREPTLWSKSVVLPTNSKASSPNWSRKQATSCTR